MRFLSDFGFRISDFRLWIGGAVVALAVALGVWLWASRPRVEPPLPDLSQVDDEIVKLIGLARGKVLHAPKSATAWGHLGEVLLAHSFNHEANLCFQQAELLDPAEPAWPYLQGVELFAYDPEACIPCLERAVRRCSERQVVPRLLLAEALLERGRLDEAEALVARVPSADPYNMLRARLLLGRLEILRQNPRAALTQLEACRDSVHSRKRALALCAGAWNQLGEMDKAVAEQRSAADLPDDLPWPDPYYEKVVKLQTGLRARFLSVERLARERRIPEAIQLLNQTLEKYPSSLEGWMRLGEAWNRAQNLDRAQACFQMATELAPDHAEAWLRLGRVQAQTHDPQAEESFRRAIQCKPHSSQAHYNLGLCLKEQGRREDAAAEFREALRCQPDYDPARTALREIEAIRK
ncbi:MAG TPA: tetratricopeptide repeat protein [Gemmataceae bacterium]